MKVQENYADVAFFASIENPDSRFIGVNHRMGTTFFALKNRPRVEHNNPWASIGFECFIAEVYDTPVDGKDLVRIPEPDGLCDHLYY